MGPRPRAVVLAIAVPVTAVSLAILVSFCRADNAAGAGAGGAAYHHPNATQTLAASLGRGLGCCRSHSPAAVAEGLLSLVHVDAASPLCVHVF